MERKAKCLSERRKNKKKRAKKIYQCYWSDSIKLKKLRARLLNCQRPFSCFCCCSLDMLHIRMVWGVRGFEASIMCNVRSLWRTKQNKGREDELFLQVSPISSAVPHHPDPLYHSCVRTSIMAACCATCGRLRGAKTTGKKKKALVYCCWFNLWL